MNSAVAKIFQPIHDKVQIGRVFIVARLQQAAMGVGIGGAQSRDGVRGLVFAVEFESPVNLLVEIGRQERVLVADVLGVEREHGMAVRHFQRRNAHSAGVFPS